VKGWWSVLADGLKLHERSNHPSHTRRCSTPPRCCSDTINHINHQRQPPDGGPMDETYLGAAHEQREEGGEAPKLH